MKASAKIAGGQRRGLIVPPLFTCHGGNMHLDRYWRSFDGAPPQNQPRRSWLLVLRSWTCLLSPTVRRARYFFSSHTPSLRLTRDNAVVMRSNITISIISSVTAFVLAVGARAESPEPPKPGSPGDKPGSPTQTEPGKPTADRPEAPAAPNTPQKPGKEGSPGGERPVVPPTSPEPPK